MSTPTNKHINRFANGYQVRIQRKNGKKNIDHSVFFSTSFYGTKRQTLTAAKNYRDGLLYDIARYGPQVLA